MKKSFKQLALVLVFVLLLSGCSTSNDQKTESVMPSQSTIENSSTSKSTEPALPEVERDLTLTVNEFDLARFTEAGIEPSFSAGGQKP